jgi:hypothetical protein
MKVTKPVATTFYVSALPLYWDPRFARWIMSIDLRKMAAGEYPSCIIGNPRNVDDLVSQARAWGERLDRPYSLRIDIGKAYRKPAGFDKKTRSIHVNVTEQNKLKWTEDKIYQKREAA